MSLSYYSMSPEKFPSSAEKNTSPKEAIVQSGEMLWNILQKLGANPTLQTEVTWKRGDSEEMFPLSSNEWKRLPIGAKVKVENGKISVENPGYSPKPVEKKEYSPVKRRISQEESRAEYKKEEKADDMIDGCVIEDAGWGEVNLKEEQKVSNDLLDNDFEQKEREGRDVKMLDKIFNGEVQDIFDSTQASLKEAGISAENISIWKEFCFSENMREFSVGSSARAIKLVKNLEFHVAFQELITGISNNNLLEKEAALSPKEFRSFLTNLMDEIVIFIDEQELLYKKLEANKTKEDEAKENIKQKNAEILIDELLPIPYEKELLWNKYFEEGNMMELSMDYMDYRGDKLGSSAAGRYISELLEESMAEALTLDYFLGEVAREKSPILYKIYLLDGLLL